MFIRVGYTPLEQVGERVSQALFNRCVVNWMGSWSKKAFVEVARHFVRSLDLPERGARNNITDALVSLHCGISDASPRDFLTFLRHFSAVYAEKRA
jgi:hypothetical protein